jgi:Fe-S-cluster containining protein
MTTEDKKGWGGGDAMSWLVNRGGARITVPFTLPSAPVGAPPSPPPPPPAPPQLDETAIRESLHRAGRQALGESRTADRLALIVREAGGRFDEAWEGIRPAAEQRDPAPIACKAGCAFCCNQQVTISPAEAITMARHARATFTPEALAAVKQRLAALDDRARGLGVFARGYLKTPCAFLVDGSCSIYEARPIRCRSVFSRDVKHCQWVAENPNLVYEWQDRVLDRNPYVDEPVALADALLSGLTGAVHDAGLAANGLELTAALRIALDTPDVEARYFRGEAVFAPAAVPPADAGLSKVLAPSPPPSPPLNPERIASAVSVPALDALRAGRTPHALAAAVAAAGEVADRAWAEQRPAAEARKTPGFACGPGCAWCCHQQVSLAPAEAVRIARHVLDTFPPDALAALKKRLTALDDRARGLGMEARAQFKTPCALLIDGQCSIYAVRPLRCRGVYSRDAGHCRWAMENPGQVFGDPNRHSQPGPYPVEPAKIMDAALTGLARACHEFGLAWEALELTAALRIALETPDFAPRYLASEPIFAAAALPARDAGLPGAAAGLAKPADSA